MRDEKSDFHPKTDTTFVGRIAFVTGTIRIIAPESAYKDFTEFKNNWISEGNVKYRVYQEGVCFKALIGADEVDDAKKDNPYPGLPCNKFTGKTVKVLPLMRYKSNIYHLPKKSA